MLDLVKTLRKAGFYKDFECFSDEDILGRAALIKEERFKKTPLGKNSNWVPPLRMDELVTGDRKKAFPFSTELTWSSPAVLPNLNLLFDAMGQEGIITELREEAGYDDYKISCKIKGMLKCYIQGKYTGARWIRLAQTIIPDIRPYMEGDFYFTAFTNPKLDAGSFTGIRLLEEEKEILEKELDWYFNSIENIFEGIHYGMGKRALGNGA